MEYERNGKRKLKSIALNGTKIQYRYKNNVTMSYKLLKINFDCQT